MYLKMQCNISNNMYSFGNHMPFFMFSLQKSFKFNCFDLIITIVVLGLNGIMLSNILCTLLLLLYLLQLDYTASRA
jgi:hypothetical protein